MTQEQKPSVPSKHHSQLYHIWVIDQALGQDGWMLAKSFCVFMD